MRVSLLFLFIVTFSHQVMGLPLNAENFKKLNKVIVLPGDYDPWTINDQKRIEAMIASGKADAVVVMPSFHASRDIPLPISNRIKLLEASLEGHPHILYPSGDLVSDHLTPSEVIREMRKMNTEAKISFPKSSRWPIQEHEVDKLLKYENPTLDPNIREFLSENSKEYFERTPDLKPSVLDEKVYSKILSEGYYLGKAPANSVVVRKIFDKIIRTTKKLGMWDQFRDLVVNLTKKSDLKTFSMNGKDVSISKYLSSGLNGDAFVIEENGAKEVLKLAKNRQSSRDAMIESTLTHEWLKRNSSIMIPDIEALDPEGRWILLEMVKGKQLDVWIAENGGKIPPELDHDLRKFYEDAARLNSKSAIKLDISGDNIFISHANQKPILVDFGPLPYEMDFAPNYETAKQNWMNAANRLQIPCRSKNLNTLLNE